MDAGELPKVVFDAIHYRKSGINLLNFFNRIENTDDVYSNPGVSGNFFSKHGI